MTEQTYIIIPAEDQEIWKPIVSDESRYEISNKGRFRRRCGINLIKVRKNANGYICVTFWRGAVHINKRIHKLMMEAFIGPCPKGYVVNHINGIKDDNRLENLEYIPWQSNIDHGVSMGFFNKKLTKDIVKEIKYLLLDKDPNLSAIGRQYNVTPQMIYRIRKGIAWKHVVL